VSDDTYLLALTMLARRELSEAQLRQRLRRRRQPPQAIEAAIARLTSERTLDDARVAEVIARVEAALKKRGPLRVKRKIEAAGIAPATAARAVDEAFATVDQAALLDAALARRLRSGQSIESDADRARLYRYLVAQGFDPDEVRETLWRRAPTQPRGPLQ
jgi:regulatory protein